MKIETFKLIFKRSNDEVEKNYKNLAHINIDTHCIEVVAGCVCLRSF